MTASMPSGLSRRASRFWQDVTDRYALSLTQELALVGACREIDIIDRIAAALNEGRLRADDPLLAEVREQRVALQTSLRELNLTATPERGLRLVVNDDA